MSIADFTAVIRQAKAMGVFQVALGGGNPNQHPQFAAEYMNFVSTFKH